MAREIFLLDYGDRLSDDMREYRIKCHADFLMSLGVAYEDQEPFVVYQNTGNYEDDARQFAEHLGTDKLVAAEFLGPHWKPPFVNDNEASAHIIGITEGALSRDGLSVPTAESAQTVVIAQPELANEFLRHNPNGIATRYAKPEPQTLVFNHYYIQHVKLEFA